MFIYLHAQQHSDIIANAFREETAAANFVFQSIAYSIGAGADEPVKKKPSKKKAPISFSPVGNDPIITNSFSNIYQPISASVPDANSEDLKLLTAQLKTQPTIANVLKAIELYEIYRTYVEGHPPSLCHTLQEVKVI